MKRLRRLSAAAVLAYLATGTYTVGTDERAIVRRFGRVVAEQSEPGLHYGLPWGLDRVDRAKPSETKTVTIGTSSGADRLTGAPLDPIAQFLTGDQNVVNVKATVQYAMDDPKQFLLGSIAPERIVVRAAETAITTTLVDQSIDAVLTSGKDALAIVIQARLQETLRDYDIGIQVRSVSLTELAPPQQVADAFTRASSARSDRERLILEAKAYANEKRAQAQSEAQEATDQARAASDRATDMARSEADRFKSLYYEYRRAPAVTATRMYLEAMAEIIPRFRAKLIIDSGPGVDVTIIRNEQ